MQSYVQTYLERDLRNMEQVGDLETFRAFFSLVRASTGQVLNHARLGRDAGVSAPTARRWLNLLVMSRLVLLLPPYHRNFGKRIRKSPNLHLIDPGLASWMLAYPSTDAIMKGPALGALTESAVVGEPAKAIHHGAGVPRLHHSEQLSAEVDVVVELDGRLYGIELKATRTPTPRHADSRAASCELTDARGVLACRTDRPARSAAASAPCPGPSVPSRPRPTLSQLPAAMEPSHPLTFTSRALSPGEHQAPIQFHRPPPMYNTLRPMPSTTFPIPPPPPTPPGARPASFRPTAHPSDLHYTPPAVAQALVHAARHLQPQLIADLAAGNGDLLLAAERLWPAATFVATDIDHRATRRLARLRPSWAIGRCDLRNPRSRSSSRILAGIQDAASLLLLNPPFSCRGGTRFLVQTPDGDLYASTAMSFLLLATTYLAPNGNIFSILPLGCLHNSKDATARHYLRSKYHLTLLHTYPIGTFPRSTASTALVRLSPPTVPTPSPPGPSPPPIPMPVLRVSVIRGCCPLHEPKPPDPTLPLVHYTDLRNGTVTLNGRRGFGTFRCVTGPALLLPRVGDVTPPRIAVLDSTLRVMLSDCLIALKPTSPVHIQLLRTRLLDNFNAFRTHYIGTGAPFITLARLTAALKALGVQVDES